jgi:tRNA methyl transferase
MIVILGKTWTGNYVAPRPGPILVVGTDIELGRHNGLWTYTIGQGAKISGLSTKLFVVAKDHEKNAIYVAPTESVVAPLPLGLVIDSDINDPFFSLVWWLVAIQRCSLQPSPRTISPGFGGTHPHPLPFCARASALVPRSATA